MTDLPVILFPHTHVSEKDSKKILAAFGSLTVCQPWFMDGPMPKAENEELSSLRIVRPVDRLKPLGNFKSLLSEYRMWMMHNRDKGHTSFLNAFRETGLSEDNPWEIRQMIHQTGDENKLSQEDNALKWHLILHLAREFEENRSEAEEMLSHVKRQEPPLAQALGDGAAAKDLLEDLPHSEIHSSFNRNHLGQIFEAWLGLFGSHLQDHGPLITLDKHVMQYAADIFNNENGPPIEEAEDPFFPENSSIRINIERKDLPRFSHEKNDPVDPLLTYLSGRTIVFLID